MRFLIIIVTLTGCHNFYDLRDRATPTAEACDLRADSDMDESVFWELFITEGCRDSILSDFRAENMTEDSEEALVNGAWALLNYDWQDISDPSLYDELNIVRQELGEQPNGFTMYNWVAAQFESTTFQEGDNSSAAYSRRRDQLLMDDYMTQLRGSAALVHEAHHARGSGHIKCPHNKEIQCDDNNLGAYTASIAVLKSAPSVDEYVDEVISEKIRDYKKQIVE